MRNASKFTTKPYNVDQKRKIEKELCTLFTVCSCMYSGWHTIPSISAKIWAVLASAGAVVCKFLPWCLNISSHPVLIFLACHRLVKEKLNTSKPRAHRCLLQMQYFPGLVCFQAKRAICHCSDPPNEKPIIREPPRVLEGRVASSVGRMYLWHLQARTESVGNVTIAMNFHSSSRTALLTKN